MLTVNLFIYFVSCTGDKKEIKVVHGNHYIPDD